FCDRIHIRNKINATKYKKTATGSGGPVFELTSPAWFNPSTQQFIAANNRKLTASIALQIPNSQSCPLLIIATSEEAKPSTVTAGKTGITPMFAKINDHPVCQKYSI